MDAKELEISNDPPPLPLDLLIEILKRVPVKPILRFKCVSKQWYGIIDSPNFTKLHVSLSFRANSTRTLIFHKGSSLYALDFHSPDCHATKLYYSQNFNHCQPDKLVGSCNGLLCFTCKGGAQLALYNPVTRAYKILPQFPWRNFGSSKNFNDKVAFAYDCISNDYKVLCDTYVESQLPLERIKRFEYTNRGTVLYSLSTNAWEIILSPPWSWKSVKCPCVVVNNSFHWMDCMHKEVKCFDHFTQRYYVIPLPEKVSPGYSPELAVLRGQLVLVTYYIDIWILKEYDVPESWTRMFRCSSSQWNILYSSSCLFCWGSGLSIACSKDGCKILVARAKYVRPFLCCDLESQETTVIEIPGISPNRFSSILPWVESLAPLSE